MERGINFILGILTDDFFNMMNVCNIKNLQLEITL